MPRHGLDPKVEEEFSSNRIGSKEQCHSMAVDTGPNSTES